MARTLSYRTPFWQTCRTMVYAPPICIVKECYASVDNNVLMFVLWSNLTPNRYYSTWLIHSLTIRHLHPSISTLHHFLQGWTIIEARCSLYSVIPVKKLNAFVSFSFRYSAYGIDKWLLMRVDACVVCN